MKYYEDLFPERRRRSRAGRQAHRRLARAALRVLAARDSLQLPARLSHRAHGARPRQSVPRPRPRRSAAAVAVGRAGNAAVVLLEEAVRAQRARAADAGRVRRGRRGEPPDAVGGAGAERRAAAGHAGHRLRRQLGPPRRQGRHLVAPRHVHRPERRHAGRSRAATTASIPARAIVTGWPQSDFFHGRRPAEDFEALARRHGLDPSRPVVLVMGNTPTNTPYEPLFFERLLELVGGERRARAVFAAVPPASARQEVGAAVRGGDGAARGGRAARGGGGHALARRDAPVRRVRRLERRDDPARLARQRPAGGVRPLRRGRSCRGDVGGEERARRPLPRAHVVHGLLSRETFDEVTAAIERALEQPASSRRSGGASRGRWSASWTGGGERVVDAIVRGQGRPEMALQIAVIGSGAEHEARAAEVGRLLAERGDARVRRLR